MVWIALTFLSHSSDSVVKKTDFDEVAKKVNAIQINEIEKKIIDHDHSNRYINTHTFNELRSQNFKARLAQTN